MIHVVSGSNVEFGLLLRQRWSTKDWRGRRSHVKKINTTKRDRNLHNKFFVCQLNTRMFGSFILRFISLVVTTVGTASTHFKDS